MVTFSHIFPDLINFSHKREFPPFFLRKGLFNKYDKFTKCITLLFLKLFWRKRAQFNSFTKRLPKDHILLKFKSQLRHIATSSSFRPIYVNFVPPFWNKSMLWIQTSYFFAYFRQSSNLATKYSQFCTMKRKGIIQRHSSRKFY